MASAARTRVLVVVAWCGVVTSACGGFMRGYEYEEELYLALDGSATLNLNASVASLVALRGADLPLDPNARLDRARVRQFFEGPGADVAAVSLSRRDGRQFVHVRVNVADVHQFARLQAFAWSTYQFTRQGEVMEYRQAVGPSADRAVGQVGWVGDEIVAFRVHVPSEIPFHTSPRPLQRGNILEWEQPLAERQKGAPLEIRILMEPTSILYTTLLLFASTIVMAALAFGGVVWWIVRRGRMAEPS
jgi:hypothetical protein